jgi:hypothetical protein
MSWRKRLQDKPPERDPTPIYVATFGLLMSVASYAIPDEGVAGTVDWQFNPGLGVIGPICGISCKTLAA